MSRAPPSRAGYTGVGIATIKNGETVPSGKPMTTDDGSGPINEFDSTQPQAPTNGVPPAS